LCSGFAEIENGIDDIALGVNWFGTSIVLRLKVMFDECPFVIG
jgi:hypothetical protein